MSCGHAMPAVLTGAGPPPPLTEAFWRAASACAAASAAASAAARAAASAAARSAASACSAARCASSARAARWAALASAVASSSTRLLLDARRDQELAVDGLAGELGLR